MFFWILRLSLFLLFFFLWGDYIKMLIHLEVVRLILIIFIMVGLKMDYFSINFFFSCLIFLVCESSMGFLSFIFYIRVEVEVVKKLNLVQY